MSLSDKNMVSRRRVSAILLAGGSGVRFGADGNKVYAEVGGRPILDYSLSVLLACEEIDECLLVVREDDRELAGQLIGDRPVRLVAGGATRQESVLHGIREAAGEIVLIHDGARPLIRKEYVKKCLQAMEQYPGCTMAVRSKDTIKLSNDRGEVIRTTERANTWIVQTPQCFEREILLNAHRDYGHIPGITDDCMLLELAGKTVKLIEGDYTNIKITTPDDRALAETFLAETGAE